MSTQPRGDKPGSTPVFSILVPSYNPGRFAETAFRSALDQMGPDDELLIQDAGSTDGTQDVIAALARADQRVKPVIEPDRGQSDALNRALARAKPSWTIWLNSDDVLLPDALDGLRKAIAEHPDADIFYGDSRMIREDGTSVDLFPGRQMELKKLLLQGPTAFSGSIVMRDTTLRELGGFAEGLHCSMDYDLQVRIAQTGLRQAYVPVGIGALRFHDATKAAKMWPTFVKESYDVRMRYSRTPVEKLYGVGGAAFHLAQIPVFKLRLTPTYRALRRWLSARLH
ncbi:glycosyl transferase [Mycolicibacter engbaekii]|uniref:Glycosyl transferase n=1 Tax=Mycolicibacter engbaekii TaxID=188915 RepID=A0A1X1TM99_9MYCO|nr:glycosyltransferase [Mycolicibacter engbaekii]ORV45694.1 glycosyl transferase [Mycolicibacter engbaekii]